MFLITAFLYLTMSTNIFWLNQQSGFGVFDMLDVKLFYDAGYFQGVMDSLSGDMILAYLNLHIVDYIFILFFYPALALWMSNKDSQKMLMNYLFILPLIAMVFDLTENIIIDIALFRTIPQFFSQIMSSITFLKFFFIVLGISLKLLSSILERRKHDEQQTV